MKIAIVAAGFTPDEADRLRRAMATFRHVGTIHTFRHKFIAGMVERGYERQFAERCFNQIEGFGEYGFPESHAASFALLVYVSAWIKCHYPDAFCAALLNSQPMGFYAPAQLVRDAREHGVEVRHPDINASDWDCTLARADDTAAKHCAVQIGLRLVGGLSTAHAEAIVEARGAGYGDLASLWKRSSVPLSVLERLADADVFRSLKLDRRQALWAVKGLDGGTGQTMAHSSVSQAAPLFAASESDDLFIEPAVDLLPMTLGEHVVHDYSAISLSLKAHPCAFFRDELKRRGIVTSAEHWNDRLTGRRVNVAGLVLVRQRPGTAKGVIFVTLEDETGIVNCVVWPKIFERFRRVVMTAQFLMVRGRIQREGLVSHVVAEDIVDLSAMLRTLGEGTATLAHTTREPKEGSWTPKSRDFH